MKLLGISVARSIWLVRSSYLNPHGNSMLDLPEVLQDHYHFQSNPRQNPPTKDDPGQKWAMGEFSTAKAKIQITSLILHSDGIVVDVGSDTDDGDRLCEEFLDFIVDRYDLPNYKDLTIRRKYLSELFVEYAKQPALLNPSLSNTAKKISALLEAEGEPADVIHLQLGPAPNRPGFRIEREAGTVASENRFYSSAPIQTKEHLAILKLLEG